MISRQKLFSQVSYQIIGRVVIASLGVFVTALLSRHLGVRDFGTFNFLLTLVYLFYLFADYGLQTLLIRNVATERNFYTQVSQFLGVRILLSAVVTVILVILSLFLSYSPEVKLSLLILAGGEAVLLLVGVLWAVFQGKVAFGRLVIIQIAMSVIQAILMLGGVVLKAPLLFFAGAHTVVNISGLALSWLGVKKYFGSSVRPEITVDATRKILNQGYPFAVGLLVSVAYFKMDTLILGYYFDPQKYPDVGLYSLAYKPFEVMTVLGGYVSQTLYPLFIPLITALKVKHEFKEYAIYSVLMALGSGVFLYFGAPFLIMVLGGSEYALSTLPLKILSLAAIVTILSGYFVAIALAGGKEKQLMYYGAVALAANVVLNIIWVPTGSYIATSWTTVITQTIIMIGNAFAAWDVVNSQRKV